LGIVLNRFVAATFVLLLFAASTAAQTVTHFEAVLTPDAVITSGEMPSAGISDAFGSGQFTLTQPAAGPVTLAYSLQLTGVDLNGAQTPGFPNDDVTAIHFHDTTQCPDPTEACLQGIDTVGTMHVLNIFGFPRVDDADAMSDPDAGTVTGIWDDTDENLDFPPSNALTGMTMNEDLILDLLFDELLFVNVHTNAFGLGEIGGYIRLVPEPAGLTMIVLALAALLPFRR
jgi:hypothetical protein